MSAPHHLLIFGLGYSVRAIATLAQQSGFAVSITSRNPQPEAGLDVIAFSAAQATIAAATHIISTAAPDAQGDPVLARYAADIAAAPRILYLGYLSTTGIYGNRDGAWVDEDTKLAPTSARGQRRLAAEQSWSEVALARRTLDIFRLAGIYGPGRSMFDDLRAGTARHVVKPGHLFGRIHVADIAQGVVTAMRRPANPGVHIFNFTDDEPAASAQVVVEAARLLGVAPPPPLEYAQAMHAMSPMALSFWAENRRVANAKTKAALSLSWRYPTYREGLAAILAEESGNGC